MLRSEERWVAYLTGKIDREGDWYVARCDGLPVVTQGRTDGEAIANLIEAAQMFIESCIERGTLDEVLAKHHWRPSLTPPQDVGPGVFAIPVPLPQVVKRQLEACPT
jgi:predicted RNase H-like HicB family nuclease